MWDLYANLTLCFSGQTEIELDYECYYSTSDSTANSACVKMNLFDDDSGKVEYAFNQQSYEQISVSCEPAPGKNLSVP
jgi:hypothetical protein